MGNYNSQYESYYSQLAGRKNYRSHNNPHRYNYNVNSRNAFDKGNLAKRFMRELAGVLCLMFAVIMCKLVVTPETTAILKYSKRVVNESIDYGALFEKAKEFRYSDVQAYTQNLVKNMKINSDEIQ